MRRPLFLLILLPTLAWGGPKIRIEPAAAILGKPLTIVIPLDDAETTLAGLPDLGPFEPLAPPLRSGGEIRLVVLPMRPGKREIPPFPLQLANSRQTETLPLTVEVLEGISGSARIAPFKGRPIPLIGTDRRGLAIALAAIAVAATGLGWGIASWRRRIDHLPPQRQLERLQRRLRDAPSSSRRDDLLARIDCYRFAPIVITDLELRELRADVASLTGGRL